MSQKRKTDDAPPYRFLIVFVIVTGIVVLVSYPWVRQEYNESINTDEITTYVKSELFDEPVDEIVYVGEESDRLLGPNYRVYNVKIDNENYRVNVYNEVLNGDYRTDIEPWNQ